MTCVPGQVGSIPTQSHQRFNNDNTLSVITPVMFAMIEQFTYTVFTLTDCEGLSVKTVLIVK